jgi:SAM-dependent methyltransferase
VAAAIIARRPRWTGIGLAYGKLFSVDEYLRSNRAMWNEWADINAASEFYALEDFRKGGTKLRSYELEEVGPVRGKSLLHLQCHFGMDTLSWAREGADVTGADFSERSLEIARQLADKLELRATFVHSDLYELPSVIERQFDVVYTSRGVLYWLPDLVRWGQIAAHFLHPGGIFYITEVHPFIHVFDDELVEPLLRLRYPYWTKEKPLAFENIGSYADRTAPVTVPKEYGWTHALGEVITALADAGLRIDFVHEFDFCEWDLEPFTERGEDGLWRIPPGRYGDPEGELPLFFSLRATKPA